MNSSFVHSYTTKNTNLTTTSAILGSVIIAIGCAFVIWCCMKVFCKKEPERIFPSLSTMDLRGIGNRDVRIEMDSTNDSSSHNSEPENAGRQGDKRESEERKKSKKVEESKKKNKEYKKEEKEKGACKKEEKEKGACKKEEKEKKGGQEKENEEKKWWEVSVSLSDLIRRQKQRDVEESSDDENGTKNEESGKEKGESEKEKGEPEKPKKFWDPLHDESFYSPNEDN